MPKRENPNLKGESLDQDSRKPSALKRACGLFIFILATLPVVFSYQNCSFNNDIKFTGVIDKLKSTNGMGGNGEPYEEKPKEGLYVRYVPGLSCADNIARPYQELTVSADSSVSLKTRDFNTCETTQDPIAAPEINHTDFNADYVGYKDGVFVNQQNRTTLPTPPEAWCRVRSLQDEVADIVVTADAGNAYTVKIFRANNAPLTLVAGRDISNRQVTYKGSNFNLTLNMDQLPLAPRKNLMVFSHLWDGVDPQALALNADHNPPIPTSQWFGPISYQHTYNIPANIPEGTYILENGLAEFVGGAWQSEMLDMGPGVTIARPPYLYDAGRITVSSTLPTSFQSPASLLADGLGSLIRIFQASPNNPVVRPGSSIVLTLNWLAPPAQMPSTVQYDLGGQSISSQVDCRVGGVFDFRSEQKPLQ